MRILIAECKQEVSTFNPVPSHYSDFYISYGDDILEVHRGGMAEAAGALSVFDALPDVTLVPTYSARARTSAGTLAAPDWDRIAAEFLASLRKAPPVDAAYFSLHGAMGASNEDDPEGYLLAESRKILGEEIPIVISLDLHGVLTDRMLQHSDAAVAFHTYPHRDTFETGVRAARLLLRILCEGARPVTARVKIPALVRGDELKIDTGLLGRFVRRAQEIEASPGGLSAAMLIGNPFTDVPDLRSNSLVVIDGDAERAEREALALAQGFWEVRAKLQAPLTSIAESIEIARDTDGTVIFTDAADATSSGAPGDSNAILRGLLDAGFEGSALMPIVDQAAVEAAFAAGVGAAISVPIGGSLDRGRHQPVTIQARVRMLSDGQYASAYSGRPTDAGPTAVLQTQLITLIVTSRSVGLTDRSLFWGHGQDPKRFEVVVVKSPHCRYEYFEAWAARVITVDAPGSTSANLHSLGHTQCERPMYPLEQDTPFAPQAQIFRRR